MMVAAMATEKQHERVEKLILVAPVNPWSNHGRHLAPFLSTGLVAKLFPAIAPRATFAHGWILRRLYGDANRISAGTLEGYKRPFETNATMEYPIRILSSWGKDLRELETRLPGIEHVPTLILWGSLDRAVDPVWLRLCRVTFEMRGRLHSKVSATCLTRKYRKSLTKPFSNSCRRPGRARLKETIGKRSSYPMSTLRKTALQP